MEKRINKHVYTWVWTLLFGGFGVNRFKRGQTRLGILKLISFIALIIVLIIGLIGRFAPSSPSPITLFLPLVGILGSVGFWWFLIDFTIAIIKLEKYEKDFVFEDKKWSKRFIKKAVEKTEEELKFEFLMKNIIRVGALLLCVFFFTLPLVKCSQDGSYTASGLEIATGTGKLFSESSKEGYPLAFLLLIIPVILLIVSFVSKSFAMLRNISIVGLLAKIVFLIYANSILNSGENKGAFELTGNNYLILVIYIGLCAIAFYCCTKNKYISITTKKCPFCANVIKSEAIVCQFCGKDLPKE